MTAPRKYFTAPTDAVERAEKAAAHAAAAHADADADRAVAGLAFEAAGAAADDAAFFAAQAAASAYLAAAYRPAADRDVADAAAAAYHAAAYAAVNAARADADRDVGEAAVLAAEAALADAETMIRRDFETVRKAANAGNWNDQTPVSPEVFGELWPDGPPPGWPGEFPDEQALNASLHDAHAGILDTLTPRERQIVDLIVSKMTTKQIAAQLNFTAQAINIHRSRAMRKLDVSSVAELARLVYAGEMQTAKTTEFLALRFRAGEFAPTAEVVAELKALIHALNVYHIAAGGNGLVIDDWQIFCTAMEPEEVLS